MEPPRHRAVLESSSSNSSISATHMGNRDRRIWLPVVRRTRSGKSICGEADERSNRQTSVPTDAAMIKKIQLNDDQWTTLQTLLRANSMQATTSSIKVSERLRSNGFVASDRQGGNILTDQGIKRLNQGR